MAIFKAPRITTDKRLTLLLEDSEIVYDTDLKLFYGGNGIEVGGFPLGKGALRTERFTLSATDIANGYVELASTPPSPNSVELTPNGGPPQDNGEDFSVSGRIVTWSGLGLDGVLIVGDVLKIKY